ncbi:MAG: ATP-binding cassette domain-containing protein [Bacteroidia bacterium]
MRLATGTSCILGGSGSGKSVLPANTPGLEHPDSGEVWMDGKEVHRLRERLAWPHEKVGVVFQGAALFDLLPVWGKCGIRMLEERSCPYEEIGHKVIETLHKVRLDESVSGQAAFAAFRRHAKAHRDRRAVIHKPNYLFYDEPTTGLDPASSAAIDELMEEMAAEPGRTSVIVTHDLATVRRIASRVIMLHKGIVRFDGGPEAFFESEDEVVRSFLAR